MWPHTYDKVIDNLALFAIERAQCTTGIDGGQLKVQITYVDFKHIVYRMW